PQKVFCGQSLTHVRDLKTLLGDAKRKRERLAFGFEPDLRNSFSPVLQGGPLLRRRLFKKAHSAPPPLGTNHDGPFKRLKNVATPCPAPTYVAASPNGFFRLSMTSQRLPSDQLVMLDFSMGFPAP